MRVTCAISAASVFRNLRRAGRLKNRSRTSIDVPSGHAGLGTVAARAALDPHLGARGASAVRVRSVKRDTDAMLGSASPRKPSVAMRSRSSARRILLVAWRSTESRASSGSMPSPSSSTRISRLPPASTVMATRVAPASTAFSTSSLTTEAGRSTTSPAAIWLARSAGSR